MAETEPGRRKQGLPLLRSCEKLKTAKIRLRKSLITNGRIFGIGAFRPFFHSFRRITVVQLVS